MPAQCSAYTYKRRREKKSEILFSNQVILLIGPCILSTRQKLEIAKKAAGLDAVLSHAERRLGQLCRRADSLADGLEREMRRSAKKRKIEGIGAVFRTKHSPSEASPDIRYDLVTGIESMMPGQQQGLQALRTLPDPILRQMYDGYSRKISRISTEMDRAIIRQEDAYLALLRLTAVEQIAAKREYTQAFIFVPDSHLPGNLTKTAADFTTGIHTRTQILPNYMCELDGWLRRRLRDESREKKISIYLARPASPKIMTAHAASYVIAQLKALHVPGPVYLGESDEDAFIDRLMVSTGQEEECANATYVN
jgi:hypothetical protein